MDFRTEKFVSNFVKNQFPLFYQEEGSDFILFLKAYYEWMEDSWGSNADGYGGPVREARELLDYRDIDNTLEKFLEFFQKKYLYGIPFNVISNKRFLLKHILDVYRSKGTIQCYRLLFKLLYNEDIEVYLPGRDVLRVSDGTWVEPKYLEVTGGQNLTNYIGKTVIGAESKVTAIVENFVKESHNNDVINILYISNVLPKRKNFNINEKIVLVDLVDDAIAVNQAPSLLGSLDSITVISGGQDYKIGDVIKIVSKDVTNNAVISSGIDGILKITELSTGFGGLAFDITSGGTGYTTNAETFVYKNGANGQNASFDVGSLTSTQTLEYNTDILCDYANLQLDSTAFGFPANSSGNLTSTFSSLLSYANQVFGTIFSLDDVQPGTGYEQSANVFVRSVQLSKPLQGTLSYNTSSNTVTGSGTIFNSIFANNDVIALQANSSLVSTREMFVVKQVVSDTQIILYGTPLLSSTASATYRAAPTIIPSQFAYYEPEAFTANGSIAGENEHISAAPNVGNNVAQEAVAINSGRAYVEGEEIKAYLHSSVSNTITITSSGINYAANDALLFIGGDPAIIANGFVSSVNANGSITAVNITNLGSGYKTIPEIRINSANGSGAILTTTLQEFNTVSEIVARVKKAGIGKSVGYWSTTRGFLDSDKYVQDSYYYQDYSYEIRVAQTLNKYKDIINETFHISGSEIFGKYLKFLYGSLTARLTLSNFSILNSSLSADNITITADGHSTYTTTMTADVSKGRTYLMASEINKTADSSITVDRYYI